MEEFYPKCKSSLEWFSMFVYKHCYFSRAQYLLNILSTPNFPREKREGNTKMKKLAI